MRVTPRLQPLQLFNKAFEPASEVSASEFRQLAEAAWPADDLATSADANERGSRAERVFWDLMARERKSSEAVRHAHGAPRLRPPARFRHDGGVE